MDVDVRRGGADALQRLGCGPRLGGVLDRELEHLAADLVLQLVGRALGDDLAYVDHRDLIGELIGLLEVLRGEQDRRAVGLQLAHERPHVDPAARVEPAGRLVEEQDVGAPDQARSHVEPPPHAAGVGRRLTVARVGQPEPLEDLAAALARLGLGQAVQPADHLEVLEPGQVLVDGGALAGETYPVAELLSVLHDVEAIDLGAAAARQQQRAQDPNGGRLAGAVRSQQPSDGAGLDLQIDALQRLDLAEAAFELLGTDDRIPGHGSSASMIRVSVGDCPAEFEHGDGADAGSLAFVLGEAWIAPCLLGVDAVAFSARQITDGHFVRLGAAFDAAFTGGGQVVVPVRVDWCSTSGCEYVDDVRIGVVRQVHHRVDMLPPALPAAVMH